MAWYEVYGNDKPFIDYYEKKPHLYKRHKKYFDECNDDYLELANSYKPKDFYQWKSSLGKLYEYEKELFAKVDKHQNLIIVSYYDLNSSKVYYDYKEDCYKTEEKEKRLYMRFIYNIDTTAMYHYRMKSFKQFAYVLNTCDNSYHMGGWTDFDKFYKQYQRSLDSNSIKVLKSLEMFKYLPIKLFNKISVYNLFQVNEDMIYQYEILLKNGLIKLASDLLLETSLIPPEHFKHFKKEIMGGIRLVELNRMIYRLEQKQRERIERMEKKRKTELLAKLPKKRYDLGEYIIRHPNNFKELQQEGRELHHCVASYLNRIVSKEIDILFLRKKSNPNEPYFTIEVSKNRVTQVRTMQNQTNPEVTELVKKWNEERIS